jgi:hypothetical protein
MIKLVNRPAAEPKHVYVWVYSKDNLSKVGTFVAEILKYNNISFKKWNVFDSVGKKLRFVFDDKDMAAKAQNLIANMGIPDSIDRSNVNTDGSAVSNYGVRVKVDQVIDQNGNRSPKEGGNVQSSQSASSSSESGVPWTKWLLIGGVLIAVVIVVALIYKRKK